MTAKTICKHPVACGGPHRVVADESAAFLPPHEQTWDAKWDTVYRNDDEDQGWTIQVPAIRHYEDGCPYETHVELFFDDHEGAARLASAAPDMARVLFGLLKEAHEPVTDLGDCLRQGLRHAITAALVKAGVPLPALDGDWGVDEETK